MSVDAALARLEKVELRLVWKNEAGDFTPWLAQEGNLRLLSDAIGIDLELHMQEKAVGPYSADILCKDTATGAWVLIENQLEKTDHNHLGQLITYSAGLDAVTIIWIAASITDEHRAALDWLNEITGDDFNFFGIEIELWKIGDSLTAPKFNIVSKPNDWSKTLKQSRTVSPADLTETKRLQLEYWTAFRQYMEESKSTVKCQKPLPQHWMNHSIGRAGFVMCSIASAFNTETNTYGGEIRVEMVVLDAKKYYEHIENQKEEIQAELGFPLVWSTQEGTKSRKVYVRNDANITNKADWKNQHRWLKEKLELFYKTFSPRIRALPK
ncbi:MAG: DUF4268 domain-containing protein [Syntrophorhabdales bacterium]|jgi:hypothetical protein